MVAKGKSRQYDGQAFLTEGHLSFEVRRWESKGGRRMPGENEELKVILCDRVGENESNANIRMRSGCKNK